MSHIRINASQDVPMWGDADDDLRGRLWAELARVPDGPIVIMIHGYKFSPRSLRHSPHDHILSLSPQRCGPRAVSWPRHLGFGVGRVDEGIAIAFGWEARGTIWTAYQQAEQAGRAVARVVNMIADIAPERTVDIIAHSLGARVFLSSLTHIRSPNLGRAIIMAGAELRTTAQRAIDTKAGQTVEVINITSRENDLYDFYIERALSPLSPVAQSLGHGLKNRRMNWLDLQLDCPHTLGEFRKIGFPVAPPTRRICHWSTYLRGGMFPLYRAFIRDRDTMTISHLSSLRPTLPERRWSRICAWPSGFVPLIRN